MAMESLHLLSTDEMAILNTFYYRNIVSLPTDFAKITGCSDENLYWLAPPNGGKLTYGKVGGFLTKSSDKAWKYASFQDLTIGLRPALNYSRLELKEKLQVNKINYTIEMTYGEYPQTVAPHGVQSELFYLLHEQKLEDTGKTYTIYLTQNIDEMQKGAQNFPKLKLVSYPEYRYNGKKYVRAVVNTLCEPVLLEDTSYVNNRYVFFEVEPVTWVGYFYDDSFYMLPENILLGGIPMTDQLTFKDFKETLLYDFMHRYFFPDLFGQ